jgi:hypothetical protein
MFKATKKYVRAAPKYDESSETFKFLGVYNAGKCRFLSIAFAAFLVLTFDGRYYAVSPQRLSRRNLGFPMASSADVWVHICHAPPFKLHLSAYIFLRKLKRRISNQYCDSFYEHYVTNALTFLLSKLVYFNLSSFQALFQLLYRSLRRNTTHCLCLLSTKEDGLRYSHKFILG